MKMKVKEIRGREMRVRDKGGRGKKKIKGWVTCDGF
jgi:hypothetical protein